MEVTNMATKRETIRAKAVELLREHSDGLRYTELQKKLREIFPDISKNTISGSTWDLDSTCKNEVYKPAKGLYKYKMIDGKIDDESIVQGRIKEEEFYEPFADWVKSDLNECTEAVALGGSCMGNKWGTPDVIGIYKRSRRDIIEFQEEIITAEIKVNPSDPITAFGQAIAYKLFSSRVYLVEPVTMKEEDLSRIESLCMLFGVGLILFDANDPENPDFSIRVRSQKSIPDMFYVNQFANMLGERKPEVFKKLFG